MVRLIENIVITIDVFLLLRSEIYLFWLIDLMIDLLSVMLAWWHKKCFFGLVYLDKSCMTYLI